MKKLIYFALIIALLAASVLSASAHSATVYDDAGFLTSEEIGYLSEACDCSTNGVEFFVLTSARQMTSSQVQRRLGIDGEKDAVVLVIDKQNDAYFYEMFTYNRAHEMFSDAQVDEILDHPSVYDNIKSGKLALGIKSFLSLSQTRVTRAYEEEQAQAAREPLMIAVTALVVAMLAGGGAVLGVFLYYRRKRHGESYPLDRYAKLELTESHDRFVGSFVTRVRVQSSNSGGGGGGASGGSRGRR